MWQDFDNLIISNKNGRILGLDVGDKTIGVSISDYEQIISSGITVINRTSLIRDLETLNKIINDYKPIAIVFGWPVQTDGTVGAQCKKVLLLIEKLKEIFNGFFIQWDERFSSKITEDILIKADLSRKKRAKVIDKVAAIYILQGALDFINNRKRFLRNSHDSQCI